MRRKDNKTKLTSKRAESVWLSRGKFAFVQDWGTYGNNTFVAVGMTHPEIISAMKSMACDKKLIKAYEETFKHPEDCYGEPFAWHSKRTHASLVYMPTWKNDLEHMTTLVHETSHLIYNCLINYRGMEDETEAQAYQQQYLFSQIALACKKASKVRRK